MRKRILAAGLAAAALIPSLAVAQQTCAERERSNRVAGTVAGAALGALAGSAVSGRGARTEGAVIGGVGGASIGNQLAKGRVDGIDSYGYYDSNGIWHANTYASQNAVGYYDANGVWVDGAPNGYYDASGRWVTANSSGYYDSSGRWVPASATGYYDANGRWIAGAAPGYYDNGRWRTGATYGYYDVNGRWISGEAPGRYVNGRWVADPAPGYYDTSGRWVAGPVSGYYDVNGRWIVTAPSAGGYARDVTYEGRDLWAGAPMDVRQREAWLERRINRGLRDGSLNRLEANRALRELASIRRQEYRLARDGVFSNRDRAVIQARLDELSRSIRWMRNNDNRY